MGGRGKSGMVIGLWESREQILARTLGLEIGKG